MPTSDTLRVMCPNLTCRKILAIPESARGKSVRCVGCRTTIRIPTGDKAAAETPLPQQLVKEAPADLHAPIAAAVRPRDIEAGHVEVGISGKDVVLSIPGAAAGLEGSHIDFSPRQAAHLAHSLLRHAQLAITPDRVKLAWEEVPTPFGPGHEARVPTFHPSFGDGACLISMEPRPPYCDRGRFLVHLIFEGHTSVDGADLFPRYYFDLLCAKAELEAWVNAREEFISAHTKAQS